MATHHISPNYPTSPVQDHSVVVLSNNNPLWQTRFQSWLGQFRGQCPVARDMLDGKSTR